ncbi:MAG: hypothetical protein D6696_04545 [Acidobacteria bacterium]|nr:MAG: hypothetical protein D6696_04545 [Acidobacteriota bacterium]
MLARTITILATVLSLDGGLARLDDGATALLQPGDAATIYRVGDGGRTWTAVGRGTVVSDGTRLGLALPPGAGVAAGDRAVFDLPAERFAALEGGVADDLEALDERELGELAERLVPADPRLELAVLRLLERRWQQRGEVLAPPAAGAQPPAETSGPAWPAAGVSRPPSPPVVPGRGEPLPEPPSTGLTARVRAWAAAWSAQRVDDYLSFYARDFRPPGGLTRTAWEEQRRQRLRRPRFIDVVLDDLQASIVGIDRAEATFVQRYRSDAYQDVTRKRLRLIWEDDDWRILAEEVLEETAEPPP